MFHSEPGVVDVRTTDGGAFQDVRRSTRSGGRRPHRRRSAGALLPALAVLLAVSPAGPAAARDGSDGPEDTYVRAWDVTGTTAVQALTPDVGHLVMAYVSIAVYDAAMAVHGGDEHFAVDAEAPRGASAEAAVSAAAYRVLLHYVPAQEQAFRDALDVSLDSVPDGASKTAGVAVGEQVAAALIAMRHDDGFRAPVAAYPVADPPVPGLWIPTAVTPPPIGAYLPGMRPFAIRSADQFRPGGPPDLSSRRWARDYAEVQRIGSLESSARSAEQTLTARFWGEPPVKQARTSFQHFLDQHDLDLVDSARFLAMMSVSYADAFIACFDSKYHETFWRPVTAIRAGDTDGNRRTIGDPAWTPLLGNPNHPEYPSAHSCITPVAGIVVSRFLNTTHIDFTVPSVTGLGDRTYANPRELTREVMDARVWGGIHFRSAVEDGADIAERTAHYVLSHHFPE